MMSLDVAPNMRNLWVDRAMGLVRDRQLLSADEIAPVQSQIRRIWQADVSGRRRLAEKLRDDSGGIDFLREALSNDVGAQAQLREFK
jgi:hypothetical protein